MFIELERGRSTRFLGVDGRRPQARRSARRRTRGVVMGAPGEERETVARRLRLRRRPRLPRREPGARRIPQRALFEGLTDLWMRTSRKSCCSAPRPWPRSRRLGRHDALDRSHRRLHRTPVDDDKSLAATRPTFGGSLFCTIYTLNTARKWRRCARASCPCPLARKAETGRVVEHPPSISRNRHHHQGLSLPARSRLDNRTSPSPTWSSPAASACRAGEFPTGRDSCRRAGRRIGAVRGR